MGGKEVPQRAPGGGLGPWGWWGFCIETGPEVMSGEGQRRETEGEAAWPEMRGCQRQGRLQNPAVRHGGGEALYSD